MPYLLPDLPAPVPSQFTKVSFAAISPSCLASLHFRQSLRAEAARAWMFEAFRAVKPDGRMLRWTLQLIDKCSEGLFHKERGRALRAEKESRRRQRKISSVNQAWLTVSFLWLMTGLYRWTPAPQHGCLALTYTPSAIIFQSGVTFFKTI